MKTKDRAWFTFPLYQKQWQMFQVSMVWLYYAGLFCLLIGSSYPGVL